MVLVERGLTLIDVEYIYGFVGWGSAGKVDDVIPSRVVQDGGYAFPWQRYDNNKMAAICYYGNVMATTRWRLYVTVNLRLMLMPVHFMLIAKKKNNNNTLSTHPTAKVQSERVIDVFYIFNNTVID